MYCARNSCASLLCRPYTGVPQVVICFCFCFIILLLFLAVDTLFFLLLAWVSYWWWLCQLVSCKAFRPVNCYWLLLALLVWLFTSNFHYEMYRYGIFEKKLPHTHLTYLHIYISHFVSFLKFLFYWVFFFVQVSVKLCDRIKTWGVRNDHHNHRRHSSCSPWLWSTPPTSSLTSTLTLATRFLLLLLVVCVQPVTRI